MSQTPNLAGLILGAVLTFAFTAVIQLVLVPRAQRGTRHRERWETSVSELSALLGEIRGHVTDFRHASSNVRFWREAVEELEEKSKPFALETAKLHETEVGAARQALESPMKRLGIIANRVRTVHRRAPFWLTFRMKVLMLEIAIQDMKRPPIGGVTDAEIEARIEKATDACAELVDLIEPIALYMRPPPRRVVSRARAILKRRSGLLWARLRHPRARPAAPGERSDPETQEGPAPHAD